MTKIYHCDERAGSDHLQEVTSDQHPKLWQCCQTIIEELDGLEEFVSRIEVREITEARAINFWYKGETQTPLCTVTIEKWDLFDPAGIGKEFRQTLIEKLENERGALTALLDRIDAALK